MNNQDKFINYSKNYSLNPFTKITIEIEKNSKRKSLDNRIKEKINLENIKKEEKDLLKILPEDLIFNHPLLERGKVKRKKRTIYLYK